MPVCKKPNSDISTTVKIRATVYAKKQLIENTTSRLIVMEGFSLHEALNSAQPTYMMATGISLLPKRPRLGKRHSRYPAAKAMIGIATWRLKFPSYAAASFAAAFLGSGSIFNGR